MGVSLRRLALGGVIVATGVALAACGSSSTKSGAVAPGSTTTAMAKALQCGTATAGMGGTAVVTSGMYRLAASLGPDETMYTQADVAKMHPKTGEVMLRGEMAGSGMVSTTTAMGQSSSMGSTTTAMGSGMGSTTTAMGQSSSMTSTPMTTAMGQSSSMTTTPMTTAMGSGAGGAMRHLEVHVCTTDGKVVTDANPAITVQDTAGGAAMPVDVAVMQGIGMGTNDLHYGNNVGVKPGHRYLITVKLGSSTSKFTFAT